MKIWLSRSSYSSKPSDWRRGEFDWFKSFKKFKPFKTFGTLLSAAHRLAREDRLPVNVTSEYPA